MGSIHGMTKRVRIDWERIQEGRAKDRCASDAERDAFLSDKTSTFARIVPARRPEFRERGGL